MKILLILLQFLLIQSFAWSVELSPDEFENGPNSGKNKFQRINSNTQAIEKIMKELLTLKSEVSKLKQMMATKQVGESAEALKLSPGEQ